MKEKIRKLIRKIIRPKKRTRKSIFFVFDHIIVTSVFYSFIFVLAIFSIIFYILFIYLENKELYYQHKNLESLAKLYENTIIIASHYDDEDTYNESFSQIEEINKISIHIANGNQSLEGIIYDCIENNKFYLFFKNKKVCYYKHIDFTKGPFTYLIKKSIKIDYIFYFYSYIITLVILSFAFLLFYNLTSKRKVIKMLKNDLNKYKNCLISIQSDNIEAANKIQKKIQISEFYDLLNEIARFNQQERKTFIWYERLSIILHDINKLVDSLPLDISDVKVQNILSNIRYILKKENGNLSKFDIKTCITEAMNILTSKGVITKCTYISSSKFSGNYSSILEVFINIFSNIIEHTKVSNARVVISTKLIIKDNNVFYQCKIRNYGSYIDRDNINAIFDKNYTTSKTKYKNSGTGLFFCKKIIESHNGKIFCISEKKQDINNSFVELEVLLPIANEEQKKEININQSKLEKYSMSMNENAKLIISIIEDETYFLEKWKQTLGSDNVYYFSHPEDFLLSFNDDSEIRKTNLIITDYYFHNVPITNLLDFIMLKDVLKFKGKIFLYSNVKELYDKDNNFDFIFPCKNKVFSREELLTLFYSLN